MNNYEFLEAILKLTYEVGMTADGKSILKSKTYRNVKSQPSAASVSAVAQTLASLTSYPLVKVYKTDTTEVVTM